jgi:hypothetical protein
MWESSYNNELISIVESVALTQIIELPHYLFFFTVCKRNNVQVSSFKCLNLILQFMKCSKQLISRNLHNLMVGAIVD